MHHYVNRGVKGIALIDRKQSSPRLHYMFDISDTNGSRMPYIWQYKEAYQDRINQSLADSFELEETPAKLGATIEAVIHSLIEESLLELLDELKYSKDNSFLADLDEANLTAMLRDTLRESALATVLFRCHVDSGKNDPDRFSLPYNFNTSHIKMVCIIDKSNTDNDFISDTPDYSRSDCY